MAKTRVAVLGGGMAGLTAAYELTATPELRERYEVTLYQPGWRLGGKGASGRNMAKHARIEEHGLHVWFGFYDNAFRVMRDCYEELARPEGAPLRTWREAFEPCRHVVLYEQRDDQWLPWTVETPTNADEPGEQQEFDYWDTARAVIGWLTGNWRQYTQDFPDLDRDGQRGVGGLPGLGLADGLISEPDHLLGAGTVTAQLEAASAMCESRARGAIPRGIIDFDRVYTTSLRLTKDAAWLVATPFMDHDGLRRFLHLFDLAVTVMHGIAHDRLEERGTGSIDDLDLREWLRQHGAHERTLNDGAPLRALYDLVFAYRGGDVGQPDLAAGKAVAALMRIVFGYKGAALWKMQAGMGDVVFAPLYEVLRSPDRDVDIRFFHWVRRLTLSPDRRHVEEIEVVPQVRLADGRERYEPFVDVGGLPCWPSEPLWDQLEGGDELKTRPGLNFERQENPLEMPEQERLTLRRGVDFDVVVLAIPVGALDSICAELANDPDNPAFAAMLDHTETVATQACQLWMGKTLAELGWMHDPNMIAGAYLDPLDTYCDMSHLLPREQWTPDGARSIAYFCGVFPDEYAGPLDEHQRARETAFGYAKSALGPLWPTAVAPPGAAELDWALLIDDDNRPGSDRFDAQYWRANTTPWERYVLTTSGSTAHRLAADESGYENLFLAGDWTRTGIDGGCIEAAVISGLQASRAISGSPAQIAGEGTWLQGGPASAAQAKPAAATKGLPRYVEFGGLADVPGPYACTGTTLWAWFPKVDPDKVAALCRKAFAGPTRGAFEYRPIWPRVMLTFGRINRIVSTTPGYDELGYVSETQVVLWVPTLAVHDNGFVDVADRVAMFIPYIWVDNSLSLAAGREALGWPKTWGWTLFPTGNGRRGFGLDVFGLEKFHPDQTPERLRLFDVTPVEDNGHRLREWLHLPDDLDDVLTTLGGLLGIGDKPTLPGLGLPKQLIETLWQRALRTVALKQIRSAVDGREAALQQIVETRARVNDIHRISLVGEHDLWVHLVASHPVGRELGLESQRLGPGLKLEMDFTLENARIVWDAANRR